MTINKKTQKRIIGDYGEDLACQFLLDRGYLIRERNLQRSYKEIDIVAEKEGQAVFVEVRTRTTNSFGGAEKAIGSQKIRNFRAGVKSYVQINNINFNSVRLDFLAVDIDKSKKTVKIKHFKDIA